MTAAADVSAAARALERDRPRRRLPGRPARRPAILRRFPQRLASPGEQLLRRCAMSTRDLRDHRAGSERLFDRLRLFVVRPTPPPASARDHLDATRRRRLRVKRKIKSRHKPIPKSGNQTRRSHLQIEGVNRTPLTNLRWCSDGFEITCDNAEKVRVAFALDCCDREAVGHVATTEGVKGEDVRDLMVAAVEQRFGSINRLPATIEWLTDNGSCYVSGETRRFAREIGFEPLTTPVESPQSNGMAEAFVRTIKRDYVRVNPTPDAQTVMRSLPKWFDHYNQLHPHRALGYRSPREFIANRSTKKVVEPVSGN